MPRPTFLVVVAVVLGIGACDRSVSLKASPNDDAADDLSRCNGAACDMLVVRPCGFEESCVQFTMPSTCSEFCGCPHVTGSNANCQPPFSCVTNNGMCDMSMPVRDL